MTWRAIFAGPSSKDRRHVTLAFTKARPGEVWKALFEGDPDYARCMEAPYRLDESQAEAGGI